MLARNAINEAFRMQVPTTEKPDTWSERNRTLPSAHAKPGPLVVEAYEIMRGPLLATCERGVRKITIIASPQVGKTESMLSTACYFIAVEPTSILWLLPTEGLARAFTKEKLNGALKNTPVLKFESGRHSGKDSVELKQFDNGSSLAVAYAGSASQVAMRSARLIIADEVDRFPTIDEGDPLSIAHQRAATYRNSLVLQASSPTWAATSRITSEYNSSDMRRAFCACPHCGTWAPLEFFKTPFIAHTVEWACDDTTGKRLPSTAKLWCGQCGAAWNELDRLKAVTTRGMIRWHQCRSFECCGKMQQPLETRNWQWDEKNQVGRAICTECNTLAVTNESAGFQASKLYSPDLSVVAMARRWCEALDESPESKFEFYNLYLAQCADPASTGRVVESHELTKRQEHYDSVPRQCVMLTAGCDVQHDSIHCLVNAWTPDEQSYLVDYQIFAGDTGDNIVWDNLLRYLQGRFPYADTTHGIYISAAALDAGDGNRQQKVLDFCKPFKKYFATKGHSEVGSVWKPIVAPKELKKTRNTGNTIQNKYGPEMVGTNACKQLFFDRLAIEEGPGRIHFPHEVLPAFFDGLTSEVLKTTVRNGFKTQRFVKKRAAAVNEPLDCWCLSYVALRLVRERLGYNLNRMGDMIAAQLNGTHHD